MADLYDVVAMRRRDLADALESLTPEEWDAPSLCDGWTSRHVVVHLLAGPEFSTWEYIKLFAANQLDFDKVNDVVARRDTRTPAELLAALRANAESRFHPPFYGAEAPLTDLTVHSGDILRALERPHPVPHADSKVVLAFLVSSRGQLGFGKRGRFDGLALRATDLDWSHGTGPVVEGTGEALVMAMTGRTSALDDLTGEGVATLRSRMARA